MIGLFNPVGYKARYIVKTADETVNNSNVLQNDDELIIPVKNGKYYRISMHLYYNSQDTADFKFKFTIAGASTIQFNLKWRNTVGGDSLNGITKADTISIQGFAFPEIADIYGIAVGGADENITFQWAQNAAEATDTKVLKGSNIEIVELGTL